MGGKSECMEEKDEWVVDGYSFDTEKEYKTALEEKKAIERLSKKINLNNKDIVLALYSALITEEKLSTVIGMEYLRRLRMIIIKQKYAPEEMLPTIPVGQFKPGKTDSFKLFEAERQIETIRHAGRKNKERVRSLSIINIILLAVIGAMMYIASTSNNINILNYERQIKDKYSHWENELNEREAQIKAAEKQLGIEN